MNRKSNQKSFTLFKKFNKWRMVLDFVLGALLIFVLHQSVAKNFLNTGRKFLISGYVTVANTINKVRDAIENVQYAFDESANKTITNLRYENIRLKNENQALQLLRKENDELRELLSLKKNDEYTTIIGKVVEIFSNDYMRSCILDVGFGDGVKNNDTVCNRKGLVGRIVEVEKNWCRVLLIIDPNSNIPTRIGESQVNAIVSGNNSLQLYVSMVHEDVQINDGDLVETSSYGDSFREKIPIGKVRKKDHEIWVVPFVNFNDLNYLEIISKNERRDS